MVKSSRGFGTAFTIDRDRGEKQYVVSAKHIFGEENTFEVAKMKTSNHGKVNWLQPNHELPPLRDEKKDVIVFPLISPITPQHSLLLDGEQMQGQDAYCIGFPLGLLMSGSNIFELNKGFPLPLIRKGIIAGYEFHVSEPSPDIVVDSHPNKGFSGGPVVVIPNKGRMQVIGIIREFIPEKYDLGDGREFSINSGLTYASSIGYALKLIEEYEKST